MSASTAGDGAGGAPPQGAAGAGPLAAGAADDGLTRGRLTYADRVLAKVAEQATAQAVGVARRDVTVDVAQYRDGVSLRVSTPLPVPSLDDSDAIRAGRPVLDRVTALQEKVKGEVGQLLGRDVLRVDITVTGAVTAITRRVK